MLPSLDLDLRLNRRFPPGWHQEARGRLWPRPAPDAPQVIVKGTVAAGANQLTMQPGAESKMHHHNAARVPLDHYLTHKTGYDGQNAALFGPQGTLTPQDLQRFLQAVRTDPHQYRLVVQLPARAYFPARNYLEVFMRQVARDLRHPGQTSRPLDWLAAVHQNTRTPTKGPHAHILVRGLDHDARPVYLTPAYHREGLRALASMLLLRFLPRERERLRERPPPARTVQQILHTRSLPRREAHEAPRRIAGERER